MVKKVLISIIILAIIILGTLCIIDHNRMKNNEEVLFSTWGKKYSPAIKESYGTKIVLSLHDEITNDTAWCGTFQLIWNDLKNEIAKQDIVFTPQLKVVENLNIGTFTTEQISEESYYKIYGRPTIELKEKIEKAIKEKFNETSDILEDFDWENSGENDYFLYSMLKKEFEFEKVFSELKNGAFGNYNNVEYFGIDEETDKNVRNQVEVLYYNSEDNFAIKLTTKQNDEVIIQKGAKENNFYDIYQSILSNKENYEGNSGFTKKDTLKIPNIQCKVKEEFEEIQEKVFKFSNDKEYMIEKAIQTIEFELDKAGGRIKSEAGMGVAEMSEAPIDMEARNFNVDDTFTIFLQEEGKALPYFAAKINDITKFQTENTKIEKNEETQNSEKIVSMYETIIEDIIEKSKGIMQGAKYISLDVNSLKAPETTTNNYSELTEQQKNELLEYCKKYHDQVKNQSLEELRQAGLVEDNNGFIAIEGVLIRILKIEKLAENKAIIEVQAFRTGLGAVMVKYELKYKNGEWSIKTDQMAIS